MPDSDAELLKPEAKSIGRAGSPPAPGDTRRQGLVVAGGFVGALAVCACCLLPLALLSLGLGSAWVANLTALAPYKPFFALGTAGLLGYGFLRVYRTPKRACATDGGACHRPASSATVKLGLWAATILAVVGFSVDSIAPFLFAA